MAKHPHRLILQQKKTWRCTLPGCSFFVHLGLAHVLIGKTAECWGCGEQFILDEYALRDEMPKCMDCRSTKINEQVDALLEPVEEMTPEKKKLYKQLGLIK